MTPECADSWCPHLSELLELQRGVCAELQLIESEESSLQSTTTPNRAALQRLRIRKHNAVDQFARLVQKVEPFRAIWGRIGASLNAQRLSELQRSIDETNRTILATLDRGARAACG